uniref:Uncharacterized protein n=1 Tax=Caenorhabditis japonica TaxID=281687 RepID=A0A8R1EAY1_CAEJA
MNLREFSVNESETLSAIPEKDRAQGSLGKLLGYQWDRDTDTLFATVAIPPVGKLTKRLIAGFLGETFDPLGIFSPIIVAVKALLQDLWTLGISWDEQIPNSMIPAWEKIASGFTLPKVSFPRQVTSRYDYERVQLCIFADANKENFACTAYIRYEYEDREPKSTLIFAKTRQKSRNTNASIPRMELMAIEIAVNAAATLVKELHLKELSGVRIFSDSMIALYWVLKNDKCHSFVNNRVANIHNVMSELKEWDPTFHHVPTDLNPADIASRGCTLEALMCGTLWFDGPEFLNSQKQNGLTGYVET